LGSVFVVDEYGKSESMTPVLVKDEEKELQNLLNKNFDLLPGDQIDPDNPCRWMLIKREMPVPDPCTGFDRWSIDFFFVDQKATPTFVECKRYQDTRARREVIGQVLEYAANGQHYWSAKEMCALADTTAKADNCSIERAFQQLDPDIGDSPDDFFQEVERHLKAGEVRLVFFMEQAPSELKRLVEFLNKQMQSVEVLIVEARQHSRNGTKVVVPALFGFTEQIREIKRTMGDRDRDPVAVDWESFSKNMQQNGVDERQIAGIKKLYDACKSLQADILWGRGVLLGSFRPKWAAICSNAAPFAVYANGRLEVHLSSMHKSGRAEELAKGVADALGQSGLTLPTNCSTNWFSYASEQWVPVVETLIEGIGQAVRGLTSKAAAV
jgi:hypothetical protein